MTKNLNLEIYEFILNEYSDNGSEVTYIEDKFYTTQIESVSPDTCGYISNEDEPYKKKPIIFDTRRRSCDTIDGTIKNMKTETERRQIEQVIDEDIEMNFELAGISFRDLIKFSNLFSTKEESKSKETIDKVRTSIKRMAKLYNPEILNDTLQKCEDLLIKDWPTDNRNTHTYIKILRPKENDKIIIIGDLHGSYATFIRILLRLKKMKVFDRKCKFFENYHLIFLGDIVDRGTYGFEIVMLIYLLKLLNPNNVHINNGNHEEQLTNDRDGFKDQLETIFGFDNLIYRRINDIFKLNHSALLIENPNLKKRYVYLAHGGYPTNTSGEIHPDFTASSIEDNDKIFIPNNQLGEARDNTSNNIRWNDFYGKDRTVIFPPRGAWLIGKDRIEDMKKIGIDLTIRAHQDSNFNTKLIQNNADYDIFLNINDIDPIDATRQNKTVCYGYTHIIKLTDDKKIQINDLEPIDLLPVITISTNTDYKRNLTRDSFTILKFIEEFNPNIQGCVEENSVSELRIKNNIKRMLSKSGSESAAAVAAAVGAPAPAPVTTKSSLSATSKPFVPRASVTTKSSLSATSKPFGPGASATKWEMKYLKYKAKYLELKKKH